jgi:hypothetical protein
MMLTLALIVLQSDADAVIERFNRFVMAAKTIYVDVRMEKPGMAPGTGRFWVEFPGRMALEFKMPGVDYRYGVLEGTCTEVERTEKEFDEYEWLGVLSPGHSRISSVSEYALPIPLFARNVRATAPRNAKFGLDGQEESNGKKSDWLKVRFNDDVSRSEIRALIDEHGKLLRYERKVESQGRSDITNLILTGYVLNRVFPRAVFETNIPVGYLPYALPQPSYPLEIGMAAPLRGWRNAVSGQAMNLEVPAGKHLLLAVLDRNCPPSETARRELGAGNDAWTVQYLSLGRTAGEAVVGSAFDPSGIQIGKLRVPGTPMFYLVSPGGTIKGLWHGFGEGKKATMEKDIRDIIAGKRQD